MTRALLVGSALAMALTASDAAAQDRRPTIPVVVAQAMMVMPGPEAKTQFHDGELPAGWPAELVPPDAKVIGGGVIGDTSMFRMRVGVFELAPAHEPVQRVRDLLVRAGFKRIDAPRRASGGFAASMPEGTGSTYCRGSVVAGVGMVDSTGPSRALALHLIDGEAGRGMCAPKPDFDGSQRLPVDVPALRPPVGSVSRQSGSSWSGNGGELRAVLTSIMPVDSVLAHYTAQLAAAGWTPDGEPAVTPIVGARRFSFRSGEEGWTASLIVLPVRNRRELMLLFARSDVDDDF